MRAILNDLYKISLLKRIVPSILKIYIKIFKKNEIIIKHKKIFLKLNLFNPIDREIFLKDNYEKDQLDYLTKIIEEKKIQYFLDVGAHMGYYSINLAKKNIRTIAFEPIKRNFEQLKKNKDLNKLENLVIHNFALSNEKKDITMWVPDINKTGGFSIYDINDEEIKKYDQKKIFKTINRAEKGDDIINFKGKKIAIKLDVERHELKVLEGLYNILKNNDIILQVEVFQKREASIMQFLKSKNFTLLKSIKRDFYFKNF
jgi:FkbM family methyltransferase